MLNQQKFADILAANFQQWMAFEQVKKHLMSNGYGFEVRNANQSKPHQVRVYKSEQEGHDLNQLIDLATTSATLRGHELDQWKKSNDFVWASALCHACGAQAVVSTDPIFEEAISGNAIIIPCC